MDEEAVACRLDVGRNIIYLWQNITYAAETLTFVNHWTTTFDVLYYDAGISSRAATNIIAHRDGPDGIYGTDDDDLFDTIEELDAVPYVGPATLEDLANYAYSWYPPSEPPYAYLLDFVNHETTTFEVLDVDVGLDRRAAANIIAHRDGPDGIYGTEDDDPFDTKYELDAVPYVGPSALAKLEAYAAIWILSPLDYKEDALKLLEGLGALIEHEAIKSHLKKAEDNLSSSLKWFIDDWHIVRHSVFDKERIVTQEVRGIAKIAQEEEIPQYEQIIAECKKISQKLAKADELIAKKALEQIKEMVGVDQSKISQGYEELDKGLQRLEERDAAMAGLGIDWPRYDEAINCFKHAWQHAQQAIPRIVIPPGMPPRIDSDNDGLPDRDEDKNRNGIYEPWLGESNPYDADSDGDGIDDREEVEVYNTDPNNMDSDFDGIKDTEEIVPGRDGYVTDPRRWDTDLDGLSDGFEVRYGYNPTRPDTDGNGILDGDEDPDNDGRPNSDENKYNTNPFSPDAREDGEPFILYIRAFNPGEGGQTEAEIDISLGLGGSITYGFRSVAFPVPVLFRVTDLGPVYELFSVDIQGTDSEHVSTVGRAETYLLAQVTSGVTVTVTDLESHPEVGDPYKGTDVSIKATVFGIWQSAKLWYFNGEDPSNYYIKVTLRAQGLTKGTFKWDVTAGADKIDFENDQDTITKTDDNEVEIKSTAASEPPGNDVTIKLTYNGIEVCEHKLSVYTPFYLIHIEDRDDVMGNGYYSEIYYEIWDQFTDTLPKNVELNEDFTTADVSDYPGGDNWEVGEEGSATVDPARWNDLIWVAGADKNPLPQNPQTPLGNVKVDHWDGDWCVGSLTIGSGVRVKTVTWQRYLDHARHE